MTITSLLRATTFSVLSLLALLPACTLRGTTNQTTDTTQNTTVSTSGRSWFTEDGVVRHGEDANAFATLNFENVKQDMARGHGEYLDSLGTLLGIPNERRADFTVVAQNHYQTLTGSGQATAAELLTALGETLSAQGIQANRLAP